MPERDDAPLDRPEGVDEAPHVAEHPAEAGAGGQARLGNAGHGCVGVLHRRRRDVARPSQIEGQGQVGAELVGAEHRHADERRPIPALGGVADVAPVEDQPAASPHPAPDARSQRRPEAKQGVRRAERYVASLDAVGRRHRPGHEPGDVGAVGAEGDRVPERIAGEGHPVGERPERVEADGKDAPAGSSPPRRGSPSAAGGCRRRKARRGESAPGRAACGIARCRRRRSRSRTSASRRETGRRRTRPRGRW